MRRIAVLVVVSVILWFRRHASDKFQEAISWSITWIFLLLISQVSYVVSDHFRWSYAPVHKKKKQLKMCLHFASNSHVAPMFKTRFLRRASVWNLWKLFHPVKQWLKQFLPDHWAFTQLSSEPINWALFQKRSLTFSSASFAEFFQL